MAIIGGLGLLFYMAVVQNSFSGIWPTLAKKSVIISRLVSRNFRGAYFHMSVNLGYQLAYQHLKDLIAYLGLHMDAMQNYYMTE